MSLTSDHLERFLKRLQLSDARHLEELAATSVDPARIASLLTLPPLMLPVTDPLTGLPNRRGIVGLAEREFRLTLVCSTPLTLILFDVDNMKKINHRFMLAGGDVVLSQFGGLLVNTLLPNEFVGRFGGDRFLIVASNTPATQAAALVERVDAGIKAARFDLKGETIRITVSFGVAVADDGLSYPPAKYEYPEGGVSDELQPMIMAVTAKMEEAKRRSRSPQW